MSSGTLCKGICDIVFFWEHFILYPQRPFFLFNPHIAPHAPWHILFDGVLYDGVLYDGVPVLMHFGC